jgi:hypothetical protein
VFLGRGGRLARRFRRPPETLLKGTAYRAVTILESNSHPRRDGGTWNARFTGQITCAKCLNACAERQTTCTRNLTSRVGTILSCFLDIPSCMRNLPWCIRNYYSRDRIFTSRMESKLSRIARLPSCVTNQSSSAETLPSQSASLFALATTLRGPATPLFSSAKSRHRSRASPPAARPSNRGFALSPRNAQSELESAFLGMPPFRVHNIDTHLPRTATSASFAAARGPTCSQPLPPSPAHGFSC